MRKSITEIPDDFPMVTVRYEGATAKHSITGLATRIKYGRKRNGDTFQMHKEDVAADPERYTVLKVHTDTPAELPKTPQAVRVPDQRLRPSIQEVEPPQLGEEFGPAGTKPHSSFIETEASVPSKSKKKASTKRKSTSAKRKSTRKSSSSKRKTSSSRKSGKKSSGEK